MIWSIQQLLAFPTPFRPSSLLCTSFYKCRGRPIPVPAQSLRFYYGGPMTVEYFGNSEQVAGRRPPTWGPEHQSDSSSRCKQCQRDIRGFTLPLRFKEQSGSVFDGQAAHSYWFAPDAQGVDVDVDVDDGGGSLFSAALPVRMIAFLPSQTVSPILTWT